MPSQSRLCIVCLVEFNSSACSNFDQDAWVKSVWHQTPPCFVIEPLLMRSAGKKADIETMAEQAVSVSGGMPFALCATGGLCDDALHLLSSIQSRTPKKLPCHLIFINPPNGIRDSHHPPAVRTSIICHPLDAEGWHRVWSSSTADDKQPGAYGNGACWVIREVVTCGLHLPREDILPEPMDGSGCTELHPKSNTHPNSISLEVQEQVVRILCTDHLLLPLQHLILLQAKASPRAPAVKFRCCTLTYQEYCVRAWGLAHFIQTQYSQQGRVLVPGDHICLVMPKNEWLPVASMAVELYDSLLLVCLVPVNLHSLLFGLYSFIRIVGTMPLSHLNRPCYCGAPTLIWMLVTQA
jgi:hypothetical protein